jgi:hypothetical protein
MQDYPNGYSESYSAHYYRNEWPAYGDPGDGTGYGEHPIIEGTSIRRDVLTDRVALVALRAWVLQERDHALRITVGTGQASSLQYAIQMTDVAAVLWACICKLPPGPVKILGEAGWRRPRPRPIPRLSRNMLPPVLDAEPTDPALPTLDHAREVDQGTAFGPSDSPLY